MLTESAPVDRYLWSERRLGVSYSLQAVALTIHNGQRGAIHVSSLLGYQSLAHYRRPIWNRADHYIFALCLLSFCLSFFLSSLISAVGVVWS